MTRIRRLLLVVASVALLVVCFLDIDSPGDYTGFVAFGHAVNDGALIYDPAVQAQYHDVDFTWATWPPGFVPLASALARADGIAQAPAVVLFRLLNLAALVIALFVTVQWLTRRRPLASDPERRIAWDAPVIAIGLLIPIRLVMSDFEHTQMNLIILGLVILGARLLESRNWMGGLLIGLGSAMKATPILLLPYFIWRGRWRAFGATLLGVLVGWVALPALWLGPGEALKWWRAWIQALAHNASQYDWGNQSLRATAVRILGPEVGIVAWIAGALLLAIGILIAFGRPFRQVSSRRTAAEVATLLVAITLVSPVSWKAHYVTLVVLCAAVFVMAHEADKSHRKFALWGLAIVAAGLNLSSENFIGWDANELMQHYGIIAWSGLLLVVISLVLLYWDRTAKATRPPPDSRTARSCPSSHQCP